MPIPLSWCYHLIQNNFERSMYDIQKLGRFSLLYRIESRYLLYKVMNAVRLALSKTFCCSFRHRLSYNGFNLEKAFWIKCFFTGNISSAQIWNLCQMSLWSASYINSWNLTARLYLHPWRTPLTEPSAITPDSMTISLKQASWNFFPIIDTSAQTVWKTPIPPRLDLCWQSAMYTKNHLVLQEYLLHCHSALKGAVAMLFCFPCSEWLHGSQPQHFEYWTSLS